MTDYSNPTDAELLPKIRQFMLQGTLEARRAVTLRDDWNPLVDHNDVAMVRAEIKRKGLQNHFAFLVAKIANGASEINPMDMRRHESWFVLLSATPRDQCIAALRAVAKGE